MHRLPIHHRRAHAAEAVELLARNAGRAGPSAKPNCVRDGYPAYTTSAGWLGYSDEKIRRLCREAIADGWSHFKIKVGGDLADDVRRCAIIREEIGPDRKLMMDANQVWDVGEAIEHAAAARRSIRGGSRSRPAPTTCWAMRRSRAAIAPIGVATGEQCQNRVMFKQLMQAGAIGFCQIDAAGSVA